MIRSKYKCKSCYGRFEVSKTYEPKDTPKYCPFCGTDTAAKEREIDYTPPAPAAEPTP